MFRSYIKIAIRNLVKNKVLTFINITGLSMGMAAVILLLLNINYEYSVDQFHQNKKNLYKAYNKGIANGKLECWDYTSASLGPALKEDYPGIKNISRVSGTTRTLAYRDKRLVVKGNFTDPAFLGMFSFPLRTGSTQTALKDVYSIVITEELAGKLFGNEDPVNKVIRADNKDNFTVTAVLKDLPENTQFKFEFLLPWDYLKAKGIEYPSWKNQYAQTYAELEPTADPESVNSRVSDVAIRYSSDELDTKVFLYPFEKLHLYGRFENGKPVAGNITNIYFFTTIALIILVIACINFMNLSTARSEKRAREVGVRKVVGARKRSLIIQFIGESTFIAAIAAIIALCLVQIALPGFSSVGKVHLSLPLQSPLFWLGIIGFILFTGLLAGSYPAFYLSSFKPVKVLKGVLKNGYALLMPRKVLVVVQFVLSIVFINFTIIFQKQVDHGLNRQIGFTKENLVFHPMTDDLQKNYASVKNELINSGIAESVCRSSATVNNVGSRIGGLKWEGMDAASNINFDFVDTRKDFVKTNGLQLIAGRDIDTESFPGDTASCLLNESAVKVMGFKEPVGQIIKDDTLNWHIVGIVKDFIIGSPNQLISPLLIKGDQGNSFMSVRLSSNETPLENVKKAEAILKKYNPGFVTEYQFADAQYAAKFSQSKKVGTVVRIFALMAIFISSMGLFGLAAYMAENRTREIGIRKILGASVAGVTALLAKDFVRLVLIAIIIASPLAWLLSGTYLQQFSYRTNPDWWIIVLSGGVALLIALFTVSVQSIKTAMANPVKSLRVE